MNKDKKLVDYLQMIENNQPSGMVSGAFIEEQPNLLHKITGGVYKSFSSNGIEYDDVFQECCLAVLAVFNDYAAHPERKNLSDKSNYVYSAIKYRVMVELNKKYSAGGLKLSNRTRLKYKAMSKDSNPFIPASLDVMMDEKSNNDTNKTYSPKALATVKTPEEIAVDKETLAEAREVIKQLNDNEKKVINLVVINGVTVRQAADEIGMSKSSVSHIKQTALNKVRAALDAAM